MDRAGRQSFDADVAPTPATDEAVADGTSLAQLRSLATREFEGPGDLPGEPVQPGDLADAANYDHGEFLLSSAMATVLAYNQYASATSLPRWTVRIKRGALHGSSTATVPLHILICGDNVLQDVVQERDVMAAAPRTPVDLQTRFVSLCEVSTLPGSPATHAAAVVYTLRPRAAHAGADADLFATPAKTRFAAALPPHVKLVDDAMALDGMRPLNPSKTEFERTFEVWFTVAQLQAEAKKRRVSAAAIALATMADAQRVEPSSLVLTLDSDVLLRALDGQPAPGPHFVLVAQGYAGPRVATRIGFAGRTTVETQLLTTPQPTWPAAAPRLGLGPAPGERNGTAARDVEILRHELAGWERRVPNFAIIDEILHEPDEHVRAVATGYDAAVLEQRLQDAARRHAPADAPGTKANYYSYLLQRVGALSFRMDIHKADDPTSKLMIRADQPRPAVDPASEPAIAPEVHFDIVAAPSAPLMQALTKLDPQTAVHVAWVVEQTSVDPSGPKGVTVLLPPGTQAVQTAIATMEDLAQLDQLAALQLSHTFTSVGQYRIVATISGTGKGSLDTYYAVEFDVTAISPNQKLREVWDHYQTPTLYDYMASLEGAWQAQLLGTPDRNVGLMQAVATDAMRTHRIVWNSDPAQPLTSQPPWAEPAGKKPSGRATLTTFDGISHKARWFVYGQDGPAWSEPAQIAESSTLGLAGIRAGLPLVALSTGAVSELAFHPPAGGDYVLIAAPEGGAPAAILPVHVPFEAEAQSAHALKAHTDMWWQRMGLGGNAAADRDYAFAQPAPDAPTASYAGIYPVKTLMIDPSGSVAQLPIYVARQGDSWVLLDATPGTPRTRYVSSKQSIASRDGALHTIFEASVREAMETFRKDNTSYPGRLRMEFAPAQFGLPGEHVIVEGDSDATSRLGVFSGEAGLASLGLAIAGVVSIFVFPPAAAVLFTASAAVGVASSAADLADVFSKDEVSSARVVMNLADIAANLLGGLGSLAKAGKVVTIGGRSMIAYELSEQAIKRLAISELASGSVAVIALAIDSQKELEAIGKMPPGAERNWAIARVFGPLIMGGGMLVLGARGVAKEQVQVGTSGKKKSQASYASATEWARERLGNVDERTLQKSGLDWLYDQRKHIINLDVWLTDWEHKLPMQVDRSTMTRKQLARFEREHAAMTEAFGREIDQALALLAQHPGAQVAMPTARQRHFLVAAPGQALLEVPLRATDVAMTPGHDAPVAGPSAGAGAAGATQDVSSLPEYKKRMRTELPTQRILQHQAEHMPMDLIHAELNPFDSDEVLRQFAANMGLDLNEATSLTYAIHALGGGEANQRKAIAAWLRVHMPGAKVVMTPEMYLPWTKETEHVVGMEARDPIEWKGLNMGGTSVPFDIHALKALNRTEFDPKLVEDLRRELFMQIFGYDQGDLQLPLVVTCLITKLDTLRLPSPCYIMFVSEHNVVTISRYTPAIGGAPAEATQVGAAAYLPFDERMLRYLYAMGDYGLVGQDRNKWEPMYVGTQAIIDDDWRDVTWNPNLAIDNVLAAHSNRGGELAPAGEGTPLIPVINELTELKKKAEQSPPLSREAQLELQQKGIDAARNQPLVTSDGGGHSPALKESMLEVMRRTANTVKPINVAALDAVLPNEILNLELGERLTIVKLGTREALVKFKVETALRSDGALGVAGTIEWARWHNGGIDVPPFGEFNAFQEDFAGLISQLAAVSAPPRAFATVKLIGRNEAPVELGRRAGGFVARPAYLSELPNWARSYFGLDH